MGPGSAAQREGRCTTSGTQAGAVHIAADRRANSPQATVFRISEISLAALPKSVVSVRRPAPLEGRFAIVTSAGRDAVDADGASDEGAGCGRRSRVVLAPQWLASSRRWQLRR